MSALEFLSPLPAESAEFRPRLGSPLERALRYISPGLSLHDLSLEPAKFEVRGDLDAITEGELIRITSRRGLVLGGSEATLRTQVAAVIERTGALAGLRIEAPDPVTVMRRLTDLDLERLPAVGAVARVPALVRRAGDAFELYWPQEYGHYLATVVIDTAEGL